MSKDNGGPASPGGFSETDQDDNVRPFNSGMTMRQYAAIKLRVPKSGTDWLDEMIRTSMRDEIAAKAMMAGINASSMRPAYSFEDKADRAYKMADAMLEARKGGTS